MTTDRRTLLGIAGIGAIAAVLGLSPRTTRAAEGNFPVKRSEAEWRKLLGPDAFRVMRQEGTETPYTSPLNKEKRKGVFTCRGCQLPLFSSATKFESGTGWPSFYQPLANAVGTSADRQFGMTRTEVHCRRCGGHLGHVFDDGPPPTGKRYCMNGLSMAFKPTA
jgi:peptide-methionine (R)-S-oxide reductase